ncbi:unnamed protein product [Hyaloperonospora brassicae]|uniref:RxLR effector candidate protein n=1 Tax=Hyaloperonospora brassicae TaxID=162125 RepID=A0AAV0TTZ4_HYABA|nr:unnamed protein product [Hyaloperonospora brassicae]
MRVPSALLVTSMAVVACVTWASETFRRGPTNVDSSTHRSVADQRSAVSVNGLPRLRNIVDEDDRIGPIVLATSTAKALPALRQASKTEGKALSAVKTLLMEDDKAFDVIRKARHEPPTNRDRQTMRAHEDAILSRLQALDESVIESLMDSLSNERFMRLNRLLTSHNSADQEKGEKEIVEEAIKYERKRQASEAAEEFEKYGKGWIEEGKSIGEVFTLLQLADEGVNMFATVKLEVMRLCVEEFNKKHESNFKLLHALLIGFKSEANVARLLSFASLSSIHEDRAEKLLNELFGRWLARGEFEDDVFAILGLQALGSKGLSFEDVHILHKYILLLNKEYPNAQTDVFTCLRANLGDRAFAIQIAELAAYDENPSEKRFDRLFQPWLAKKMSPSSVFQNVFGLPQPHEVSSVAEIMSAYSKKWREQNKAVQVPPASKRSRKSRKK